MFKKLLIAGLFVTSTANAAFYTGNDLYNKLTSSDSSDRILGMGYIAGIYDVFDGSSICAKQNVTLGQLKDIVIKKLAEKPEYRHMTADNFVYVALSEAFPCPKKKNT